MMIYTSLRQNILPKTHEAFNHRHLGSKGTGHRGLTRWRKRRQEAGEKSRQEWSRLSIFGFHMVRFQCGILANSTTQKPIFLKRPALIR